MRPAVRPGERGCGQTCAPKGESVPGVPCAPEGKENPLQNFKQGGKPMALSVAFSAALLCGVFGLKDFLKESLRKRKDPDEQPSGPLEKR